MPANERSVTLRFITTGDAATREKMRVIGREASDLDGKNVDITLGADDAKAKKKFVELNLMGDRFGKRVFEARAGLDDKGAILKLDKLEFKLRKLTEKKYDAKVGIDGITRSMFEIREMDLALDKLGRKRETAHVTIRTDRDRSASGMFGLPRISLPKGAPSPGGPSLPGGLPGGIPGGPAGVILGTVLAPILATLIPGVVGTAIGGITGAAGTFGAIKLSQVGNTKIAADKKAIAKFRQQHPGQQGGLVPGGQLATDQRDFGPLLPLTGELSKLGETLTHTFARALGPLAKALGPIMTQIGKFAKAEGPALTKMFSASIPFIRVFVKIFEQAAKQLIPAFTQTMRQLTPFLPLLVRGFASVSRGLAEFLKLIGGHMHASMQLISVALKVVGAALAWFGSWINNTINVVGAFWRVLKDIGKFLAGVFTGNWKAAKNAVMDAVHAILHVLEGMWHGIKAILSALGISTKNWGRDISHVIGAVAKYVHDHFFSLWHETVHIWQMMWGAVKTAATTAWHFISDVAHRIFDVYKTVFVDIWHFVNTVWQKLWGAVRTAATDAWHFLTRVVGDLFNAYKTVFVDIWHAINTVWDKTWNWVKTTAVAAWHFLTRVVGDIFKGIHDAFFSIWHTINGIWDKTWNWVKTRVTTGWHDVTGVAKNLWQDVTGFFHRIKTDVTNIWNGVWDFVKRTGKDAINWVIDRINTFINVVDKVASFIPGVSNHLIPDIPHLAMGGWVGGSGGPTQDNQPAMLSSGERVLSHAEIANIGGRAAVDALAGGPGTGGPTHFAGGGTVPPTNNIPRFGAIPKTETLGGLMHDIRTGLSGPAIAIVHKMQNVADALIAQHEGHSGITAMVGGVAVELIQKMVNAIVTAIQGASGGGGTTGMVNPYKKIRLLTPERIDMGVDFGGSGIIGAIGPGVIGQTMNSGWPGGAFIEEKLTGGPYSGKYVYQAENIVPIVKRGQKVKAGQAIGRMTGGIEAGWGAGTGGLTMAAKLAQQAHHGDPGGNKTAMGMNFEQLLVALGVPKAPNFGGPSVGKVPPGFYSKNAGTGTATAGSALHNGLAIFQYLKANLFGGDKIAAAGAIASIYGESGWNPDSQGTGGRGLIGWTPPGTLPNSAFTGNATHDLNAQLPLILKFVKTSGDQAAISAMKRSKTILQAATIWDHSVERAGIFDVHGAGLSLAKKIMGMKHGGVIREEIFGIGRSGQRYHFGEDGVHERVTPVRSGSSGEGDTIILQVSVGPYSDPMKVAKEIHQGLREYRRSAKGGQKLGFDT